MGIFDKQKRIADYSPMTGFQTTNVSGLFSASTLATAIFADFDASQFPVDAATAITVPAVNRGLQIITSVGSRLPLVATNEAGDEVKLPWLNHTEGVITPQKRASSIIQDLIFYNHSLVTVTRDGDGFISGFQHLPIAYWSIDMKGNILVEGKKVSEDEVVYISGLGLFGFLEAARDSIRQYRNITQTINLRTSSPEPVTIISQNTEVPATDEELDEAVETMTKVLQNRAGGLVIEPHGITYRGFGGADSANAMMLEARNAIRVDVSNHLGISAALLDGNGGGNSDVYQNAVDERNELEELTLKTWTEPLADRLSQDDCTPPGIKISVDYSSFRSQVSGKANTESPVNTDD